MTDYKQLCAELLDWTRLLIEIPDPPVTRCADDLTDLLARTRAALSEPEPEGPPQPVPVSERLPGPEDCDADGRCWLCGKVEGDWRLINPEKSGVPQLKYCFSHWLPAYALPQPS